MRAAVIATTLVLGACGHGATIPLAAPPAGGHRFHDYPDPAPTTTTEAPTTTTTVAVARVETARASRSMSRGCGGWDTLVAAYAWPVDTACRVLVCESNGDPDARNPSGATGLMQILNGPTDPAANLELAFEMWSQRGWQPWDASRGCWS